MYCNCLNVRRSMRTSITTLTFNVNIRNHSKTEFMVLGTKHRLNKIKTTSMSVGDAQITSCKEVRNTGAMFDPQLSMSTQVKKLCRGAWVNLHNIGKIRSYLTEDQTKTTVHAYVTSKLDATMLSLLGLLLF